MPAVDEAFPQSPVSPVVELPIPEIYQGYEAKWQPYIRACVDVDRYVDRALEQARKEGPGTAHRQDAKGTPIRTKKDDEYDILARQVTVFKSHLADGTILNVLAPVGQPDRADAVRVVEKAIEYAEAWDVRSLRTRLTELQAMERSQAPQIERYHSYSAVGRVIAEPEKATPAQVATSQAFVQVELGVVTRAQDEWVRSPEAVVCNNAYLASQALHQAGGDVNLAVNMLTAEAGIQERAILGKSPNPVAWRVHSAKLTGDRYRTIATQIAQGSDSQAVARADEMLLGIQQDRIRKYSAVSGWTPEKIERDRDRLSVLAGTLALGRYAVQNQRESALKVVEDIQDQPELHNAISVVAERNNCEMVLDHTNTMITNSRNLTCGKY